MKEPAYNIGFKSQENEISEKDLKVIGNMPEWLSGSLIRTAPSKFEVGSSKYRHWFDPLAMLHKFDIHEGKVTYSCKMLESESYLKAKEKNKIVGQEFGTDPCKSLFQKIFSIFEGPKGTDNGCVNVLNYGGKMTANTETTRPVMFKMKNLETEGRFSYEDELSGQVTTVHPHIDEKNTVYNYMTEFGRKANYKVYSLEENSHRRKLIASIPVKEPAYMHSFPMTENYIILIEFPMLFNLLQFRFTNIPPAEAFKWKPERGTKIHLIDKRSGNIRTFETETFFGFHQVNAFEQDDEIIFDFVCYKDAEIISLLYLDNLRSGNTDFGGQLWRFRIKPAENAVYKEVISHFNFELPRINYGKINTKPYNFAFGVGRSVPGSFVDNITKIDVNNRKANIWHQESCHPGEPIFIEKPEAKTEDDGILLSVVLNSQKENSFLLVLDAKDLKEIARAEVPQHITFGFHGQYVPQ